MIDRLIENRLRDFERKHKTDVGYMRTIYRISTAAFAKVAAVQPLASHREAAAPDLYHLAGLGSAMHEDCGSCVQIHVAKARADGVDAALIRAALDGRESDMLPLAATAFRFGRAIAAHAPEAEDLRAELLAKLGETAMLDLAIAAATARFWPGLRRALGDAPTCAMVEVAL